MAVFVLVGVLCVSLSDKVRDWSAIQIKKGQAAAQPLSLAKDSVQELAKQAEYELKKLNETEWKIQKELEKQAKKELKRELKETFKRNKAAEKIARSEKFAEWKELLPADAQSVIDEVFGLTNSTVTNETLPIVDPLPVTNSTKSSNSTTT